jgi:hypothetical protein
VETGAVFSIHNGDSASVEDVRFENIRVEDARDKLADFRVGLSIYSQDCPERYHRRNPKRQPTGVGQWVPWERLTADEHGPTRPDTFPGPQRELQRDTAKTSIPSMKS